MLPLPLAIILLLLQPLLRLLRRVLLPVAGRQASLAAVTAMATLADVCPHHETERGGSQGAARRTGSEGVREGFRENVVRNPDFIYKQVHNPDVTNPDLADVRVTHLFVSP